MGLVSISTRILNFALLAGFSVLLQTSNASESTEDLVDIFGQEWGLVLLTDGKKVCDHIEKNRSESNPNVRRILITNENASAFDQMDCDGVCDFEEVLVDLTECNAAKKVGGCLVYGALYKRKFYSASIDAAGKNIGEVCSHG